MSHADAIMRLDELMQIAELVREIHQPRTCECTRYQADPPMVVRCREYAQGNSKFCVKHQDWED